MIFGLFIY